jgi:hypothetical protein
MKFKSLVLFFLLFCLEAESNSWNCNKVDSDTYNCIQKFSDGSTVNYRGQTKNEKPYGNGILKFDQNSGTNKMVGEFGEKEGNVWLINGQTFFRDGTITTRLNGKVNSFKYPNGSSYTGEFYNNGAYKNGILIFIKSSQFNKFVGSFYENGNYKEGTAYLKNGDKYKGTFKNNNYLSGKFFYASGKVINVKNGKIKKNIISNNLNIYSIFTVLIVIIFLIYKFRVDKYEKKRSGKKLDLVSQLTQFMNTPIGTWIMIIIIGIVLFKLFNWAVTDLEPGRPRFFGDVQ